MGPLKQLQQPALGAAGVQTPDAGVLYNAAHAATFEDISGSSTLPQSELATQSNSGTIPTEVDPSNGNTVQGDTNMQDNALPDPMSQTT